MARILFVEDDSLMVRLYTRKLDTAGHMVDVAMNGEEGIRRLENEEYKPDLVLLDLLMPKVNGLEVLEWIRGQERLKTLPVIVLTNYSGSESDTVQAGADEHLLKCNYSMDAVLKHVEDLLKKKKNNHL